MFEPLYKFKLDKSQKRNAKISKEDEEEIKRLYAMGIYSQGYLAKQFGISQPCVNYIVNEDRRAKKVEYQRNWVREHKPSKDEEAKIRRAWLQHKKKVWSELNKGDKKEVMQ